MVDPHLDVCGHTYEAKDIRKWFLLNNTCPRTNVKLADRTTKPNFQLRASIEEFFQAYNTSPQAYNDYEASPEVSER